MLNLARHSIPDDFSAGGLLIFMKQLKRTSRPLMLRGEQQSRGDRAG